MHLQSSGIASADAGDSGAMNNIGYLYRYGLGVTQDYQQAMQWLRKAATAGDSAAIENIGYFYEHGQGVKQDYTQAVALFRKASAAGNRVATFNMAGSMRMASASLRTTAGDELVPQGGQILITSWP